MPELLTTLLAFCLTAFISLVVIGLVVTVLYVFVNILCKFVLTPIDNFFENL